ncbi:MAG: choice-of-anchor V domain-containing protein [Bacteroidia bacterium]
MIKKITVLFFVAILCAISYHSISYGSGPPASTTGAPGEGTCITSGCHTGSPITSGSSWDNVILTSNFSTGNGYLPDSTYVIKISHTVSGVSKWGFEATVLDGANKAAGTLTTITSSSRVQKQTASSKDYVFHTSSGTSSTSSNATDWTFNWKAPKNIGDVKFYTCVMAANGNSSNDNDPVYVKSFTIKPSTMIPVANAKCKDSTHCAGTAVTLEGSSTAVTSNMTWNWTVTGATFVSPSNKNSQNPVVRYANAGNFWAILSVSNGKATSTKTDSVKITVLSNPTFSTNPNAGTYTFCKGDSLQLKSTGSTSFSYTWSNGSTTQNIFAKDTGRYTVTAKSSNGCTFTPGAIKIAHHPSHSISLKRDITNDTICFERPVVVTASSATATFDSIFYYTSNGLFQKTAINPQTHKFSASTDLFAKGKDSKGCISGNSNKFNFVVKKGISAPTASCTNKTSASFEISWGKVTGALGYKISLDSGKTWINPSTGINGLTHKELAFPPNTDIEVQIKALDIFPCNQSEITKVLCGSIPCSPLSYDIVWDKDACKGKDISFKIRNLKTNFYSMKIDGAGPFKDTVFLITADFSRTYRFELTDSSNLSCPVIKRDAAVTVWEIPNVSITSNNSQNIFCQGSPAIFDVVSKGMQEYNFYLNSVSKQKSNAPTWTLATPKNVDTVWVTIKNGACVSTSGKIVLGVKPLPTAKFTHTFTGKTATFTPNETGTAKFYWTFDDGSTDTVNKKSTHTYSTPGAKVWVKLKVKDEFGCLSTDSMEIQVPASVSNTFKESGITIYPQPAKNSFKLEVPSELINAQIILMDATGRKLIKALADKKETEILTLDLPAGVYTLMVEKGNDLFTGKVIISR